MTAATAARVAELEAERWRPTPRLVKPISPAPISETQAARHRAALLAAVYGTRPTRPTETNEEYRT